MVLENRCVEMVGAGWDLRRGEGLSVMTARSGRVHEALKEKPSAESSPLPSREVPRATSAEQPCTPQRSAGQDRPDTALPECLRFPAEPTQVKRGQFRRQQGKLGC